MSGEVNRGRSPKYHDRKKGNKATNYRVHNVITSKADICTLHLSPSADRGCSYVRLGCMTSSMVGHRLALYWALFLFLSTACLIAQTPATRPSLDVPYVPTPQDVVEQMLKVAEVHSGDVLYDLGCGDGRIVITAAQKFGARGVGIDLNPERIKEAQESAAKAGVTDRVKFLQQNLYDAEIRNATVVTLYLLPSVNMKLRPKLWRDLKPGTRVVSHSFDMGDWKPEKTVEVNGRYIYFWVIPEHAGAGQPKSENGK